jgi:hypothetical protein
VTNSERAGETKRSFGGLPYSRIDGPSIGFASWIRIDTAPKKACGTGDTVKVMMANDGVDTTCGLNPFGGDQFRTGRVIKPRDKHESVIIHPVCVAFVIMMIDPEFESIPERLNEWQSDLFVTSFGSCGAKRHIKDHD